MHTTALFSALLGAGLGCAHALIIPITRRSSPHSTTVHLSSASKNTPSGDDPFSFQGIDDLFYTGLIYASGLPFTVHLDTGSSDLWLDTQNAQLKKFTDTGVIGTITYLDTTSATGNIVLTNVMWGEFSVPQQAMINAPGSNATDGVVQGLLGIGPPLLSSVNDTLTSSGSQYDGSTFLDNVFGLYPDEPNFMTFLLSRNEFGVSDGGVFTIGDVEQNHSSITQTPELKVVAPDSWSLFMDGVIINGKQLTGGSQDDVVVPGGVPNGKTVSLLDTGTALGLAPPAYVDAMYGHIPGATFDGVDTYHVPCDSKVNISMVFGSYVYPMHPIDSIYLNALLDDGTVDCIGTFSYSNNTGGDFILGDAFMRNTYSLFDFGSWATVGNTDPFMQLLSVTDESKAWVEFDSMNAARLKRFVQVYSGPTSDPSAAADTPASLAGSLANDDTGSVDVNALLRNSYIIMGLLGGVVALLIGLIVATAIKKKSAAKGGKGYKALHDPHPAAHNTLYSDGGH